LAAAKRTQYDLICTDIVMPNMDGFMLVENIRKNDSLKNIPVIIVSSKNSPEEKSRAAALGVDRFIEKKSFNTHDLVACVRELIGDAYE